MKKWTLSWAWNLENWRNEEAISFLNSELEKLGKWRSELSLELGTQKLRGHEEVNSLKLETQGNIFLHIKYHQNHIEAILKPIKQTLTPQTLDEPVGFIGCSSSIWDQITLEHWLFIAWTHRETKVLSSNSQNNMMPYSTWCSHNMFHHEHGEKFNKQARKHVIRL